MKQYKVIYVSKEYEQISDSEHCWNVGYDTRKGQEEVLNYYGRQGWNLVGAVNYGSDEYHKEKIYLYLEREVKTSPR